MGDTLSEYLHIVVSTVVFASAIGMLMVFLFVLKDYNRGELESQRTKSSVTMDTNTGYRDEHIFILGSEVFTGIIAQKEDYPLYIDGTGIDDGYLKNVREKDRAYINGLKSRISLDAEYLVRYEYYSDGSIRSVNYIKR